MYLTICAALIDRTEYKARSVLSLGIHESSASIGWLINAGIQAMV